METHIDRRREGRPPEFASCPTHSVGLELELQLLDGQTLDLRDGIVPLMEFYPGAERVCPEFIQSCVEINSGRCESVVELRDNLVATAQPLLDRCHELNMLLCGAGTHPFSRRLALITPAPRYQRIERQRGHLAHTQITYATHVHVGMKSGEQAATCLRRLTPCLPLLVAVGANSPFWRSYETGYATYRQRLLAVTPNSGVPPQFDGWNEFVKFYETAHRAGIVSSVKDLHWNARFHPDFGTIEIRNPDAQPTISHAVTLAGLIQSLAVYCADTSESDLDPRLPQGLPHWMLRENSFRAGNLGTDCELVVSDKGRTRPLRAVLAEVIEAIRPTAAALGNTLCLDAVEMSLDEGLPYAQQRRDYCRENSCRTVTDALVERFEADLSRAHAAPRAEASSAVI